MLAFIFALKSETSSILHKITDLKEIKLADKTAYIGKFLGIDCIVAISGIGKVSAALTTQLIIDKFSPKYIINPGTCGGTNNTVQILNYYLVEKSCQFDFDLREIDDVPLGYIQEYNRVFFPAFTNGIDCLQKTSLASSDRFSSKAEDINNINQMGCSIRDMEGGSIAQVCLSNNVNYVGIKGITDVYGLGTDGEQFHQNLNKVVNGLAEAVAKVVQQLQL